MSFTIEVSEFCDKKFKQLSSFIESDENVKVGGIKGVSTKNGSYNKYYDSLSKFTPDPRYFFWMDYVKAKYNKGDILIYNTKPGGKIFHLVLNGKESGFLDVYPGGCKI
jgi:hypothetical protein